MTSHPPHLIDLLGWPADALQHVLAVAADLKRERATAGANPPLLAGKTLAMLFEKPSLRTRVSFAVAMTHLGGTGLVLRDDEVGLGKREPVKDVARVLASMCDGVMARVFEHAKLVELARYSRVPVVNGLSDFSHPCQALADFLTLQEHFGDLKGRTLAYVGDGNNVTRSLAQLAAKLGVHFVSCTPPGYKLEGGFGDVRAAVPGCSIFETSDPAEAVRGADAVYTDTWVSMGQEAEKIRRLQAFAGFEVTDELLSRAPAHCVVLHCLPAYRGLEIADSVLEGPRSLVFPQAENRLHAQKGVLAVLMGGR